MMGNIAQTVTQLLLLPVMLVSPSGLSCLAMLFLSNPTQAFHCGLI